MQITPKPNKTHIPKITWTNPSNKQIDTGGKNAKQQKEKLQAATYIEENSWNQGIRSNKKTESENMQKGIEKREIIKNRIPL